MSLFSLFSAFLLTSLSLLALKPMAMRMGLMDQPGGRKTHQAPTPLIGGVGIYVGAFLIAAFIPDVFHHYAPLLFLSALILVVGVLDDLRELPVSLRMGTQAVAAVLMCLYAGNQLTSFGDLLGFGVIELGILGLPLSVFATVGVINAVNMSDGIDGLSGGMLMIALTFLGVTAFAAGNIELMTFCAILGCAVFAFLTLNFRRPWKRPALIYLGDGGSTFLGFVLAWLLIEATQGPGAAIPPALALWFLAVPLIDTVALLIKRPMEGRSPFQPGRDHLHHKLSDMGLSTGQTVVTLYGVGLFLASAALLAHGWGASEAALFYAFLALFAAYFTALKLGLLTRKLPITPPPLAGEQ